MGLGDLKRKKATRVIGIDASTKSLAWAVLDKGEPVNCGQIYFNGSDVFERLKDAKKKTRALVSAGILRGDYVAIEAAVKVNSVQTALDLAYIYGAIISELMENNPEVHKVFPISWQTAIGVPTLKKDEKEAIKAANPDRKPSWYQAEGRRQRKARILEKARKYFKIDSGSDDVGDAVGLSVYVTENKVR